jgi:hypothetical protein
LQQNVRTWLSAPDISENHNEACGKQHDGTAAWFIEGRSFAQWKARGSTLWIHGKRAIFCHAVIHYYLLPPDLPVIAGSGKSILWYVIPKMLLNSRG